MNSLMNRKKQLNEQANEQANELNEMSGDLMSQANDFFDLQSNFNQLYAVPINGNRWEKLDFPDWRW